MPIADRTTLNNLTPNLDIGDVADPALRLAFFQYLLNLSDANFNYVSSLVTSGTLSPIPADSFYRQSIINGDCEAAQRSAIASITLASGASSYAVDRIKSVNNGSGADATVAQGSTTDLDGARFNLQLSHAALPTTGGQLMNFYTLEAKDAYKLAGQTVTFAVQVKAISGINQFTLKARYKTSETAISDASALITTSGVYDINSSGWTVAQLTFTVPARAALTTSGVFGIQMIASKSTAEASGDGFAVTQLQLNLGSTLLPYQPQHSVENKSKCFPYAYSLTDEINSNSIIGYGFAASATIAFIEVTFPTTMRTQPALVATATDFQITDGTVSIDATSISVQPGQNGRSKVTLRVAVAAGLTVNRPYQLAAKTTNKLMIFDAEL